MLIRIEPLDGTVHARERDHFGRIRGRSRLRSTGCEGQPLESEIRSRKRARVLIPREGRRSPLGSNPSLFGLHAHRQHSHGGIPFTQSLPQRAPVFYQSPRSLLLGNKDFRRNFYSPSSRCSGSLYPSRSCSEPVSAIAPSLLKGGLPKKPSGSLRPKNRLRQFVSVLR